MIGQGHNYVVSKSKKKQKGRKNGETPRHTYTPRTHTLQINLEYVPYTHLAAETLSTHHTHTLQMNLEYTLYTLQKQTLNTTLYALHLDQQQQQQQDLLESPQAPGFRRRRKARQNGGGKKVAKHTSEAEALAKLILPCPCSFGGEGEGLCLTLDASLCMVYMHVRFARALC